MAGLDRTLMLLEAVVADQGHSSLSAIARTLALPIAAAHRHVARLVENGYLIPASYGRHLPGPRLLALQRSLDARQILAQLAHPALKALARDAKCIVQLGTLEQDMVTYRIKAGRGAADLFTKIGMQMEAYCSGMGKVLLAHLDPPLLDQYLAAGPFIALTPKTITDPQVLRKELSAVRACGHAIDNEEVALGLHCVAVPVRDPQGAVIAALSASRVTTAVDPASTQQLLDHLNATALAIEARAAPLFLTA